jgi:putative hemolysin
MLIDLTLLFALIVLNGLFAMSEIAVVSSRRQRLQQRADEGNAGAARALELVGEPTRFLSTVQIGITGIGILSGAIGEAAIASRLRTAFEPIPALAPYAQPLSLGIMVVGLTYVALIVGELVPKRFALTRPEAIASVVAGPMRLIAAVARPVVHLLSVSTDAVLRLLRVPKVEDPVVTIEEIKVLIEQGTEEGVFEPGEEALVKNVLDLDERLVGNILTPRGDIMFLDVRASLEENQETLSRHPHAVLPLCDGGLDRVVGVIRSETVLSQVLAGGPLDLPALAEPASFVPRSLTLMRLLEQFKRTHIPVALVVDEYGDVDGLVSLTDVISAIVGELPGEPGSEPDIVRREDGSYLLDGAIDIETVARTLEVKALVESDDRQQYHTLGGLAMVALGRVPSVGDIFERAGIRFEVVDMDGNRVDRILASRMEDRPEGE